jgi:hypothetical protein
MTTPINAPTDDNPEDTNKDEANKYIQSIDDKIFDDFWKKLREYIWVYSATISEMSIGMNISRPVLTKFLGANQENRDGEIRISRGRILGLFNELTKEDKREHKNGKKLTSYQKKRQELFEKGPDELLRAAGLPSEKMKTIDVYPALEAQLIFMSFLYGDRALDPDIYSQIINREINLGEIKYLKKNPEHKKNIGDKESEIDTILIDQINKTEWIEASVREEIISKYELAIYLINQKLLATEKAFLFKSVLNNRLDKNKRFNLDLLICGVERTSLSKPWVFKDNQSSLAKKITECGEDCEEILKNKESTASNKVSDEPNNKVDKNLYLEYPVTRTVVRCIDEENSNETIIFEYISSGTQLRTASSSINLNMGFTHAIKKTEMGMKWLGESIISLVDSVVTVTDNSGEVISGEWVSQDLMQSLLQATMIVGSKWFCQNSSNKLDRSDYKLIIKKTAELKSSFNKCRLQADGFDIDSISTSYISKFREIGDEATNNIDLLESKLEKKTSCTFLNTSHRIHILSQLYRLHSYNARMDHKASKEYIQLIQTELVKEMDGVRTKTKENIKNYRLFLVSARVSLCVEKISYNLSFGINCKSNNNRGIDEDSILKKFEVNLLDNNNLIEFFKEVDEIIEIEIKDCIEDKSYDIYHSLASYHSIVGRVLFYMGNNREDMNEAFERFLKAACYFQKIGLTIKVHRSLTLAGRAKVRLGDKDMVDECKQLIKSVIDNSKTELGILNDEKFLSSIESRLELLEAESNLIIEEKYNESLDLCLKSMKGALWLGLNRNIMDILYVISQSTFSLDSRKVQDDLTIKFPEIFNGKHRKLVNSNNDNRIANKFIKELHQHPGLLNEPEKERKIYEYEEIYWDEAPVKVEDFLIKTWNELYKEASEKTEGEHPFSKRIRNGKLLRSYQ